MKALVFLKDKVKVITMAKSCDVIYVSHDGATLDSASRSDIAKHYDGLKIIPISKIENFLINYNIPLHYFNATGEPLAKGEIYDAFLPFKFEIFPKLALLDSLSSLREVMIKADVISFGSMKDANEIFEAGEIVWKSSDDGTNFLFNECFTTKKVYENISGTITVIDSLIESIRESMLCG